MPEPFGVTPPDLRATSEHLHDVSGRMKESAVGTARAARGDGPRVGR